MDAPQLPIVITDDNTYTDIHVCAEQGILFAVTKDDPNPGTVTIYKAATRDGDTVVAPEAVHSVQVGFGPDHVNPNADCSILGVANEGEAKYDDVEGMLQLFVVVWLIVLLCIIAYQSIYPFLRSN